MIKELLYNQSNEFSDLVAELNSDQRMTLLRILHGAKILR